MGDIDRFLAGRDEPGGGEGGQNIHDAVGVGVGRDEFGQGGPAAGVLRPFTEFGEANKDIFGDRFLIFVKGLKVGVSGTGDRSLDPAGFMIAGQRQPVGGVIPGFAALPGFEQGVGEEGESPFGTGHILENQVDEAVLKVKTFAEQGRPFDGAFRKSASAHTADDFLLAFEEARYAAGF